MRPLSRQISTSIAAIPVGITSGMAMSIFLSTSGWDLLGIWAILTSAFSSVGFVILALLHDCIEVKFNLELSLKKSENYNSIWKNKAKEIITPITYNIILIISILSFLGALFLGYLWKDSCFSENNERDKVINNIYIGIDSIHQSINQQNIKLETLYECIENGDTIQHGKNE